MSFNPRGEIWRIRKRGMVGMPQLVSYERRIFRAEPEGNQRAGITDHGLTQQRRKLPEELMGEREVETPLCVPRSKLMQSYPSQNFGIHRRIR